MFLSMCWRVGENLGGESKNGTREPGTVKIVVITNRGGGRRGYFASWNRGVSRSQGTISPNLIPTGLAVVENEYANPSEQMTWRPIINFWYANMQKHISILDLAQTAVSIKSQVSRAVSVGNSGNLRKSSEYIIEHFVFRAAGIGLQVVKVGSRDVGKSSRLVALAYPGLHLFLFFQKPEKILPLFRKSLHVFCTCPEVCQVLQRQRKIGN